MNPFIKYKPEFGDEDGQVKVYLFRNRVGTIQREEGGWRYYPAGQAPGGELMPTLTKVKQSLEED